MDYKERIRALREDNDYTQSVLQDYLILDRTPMLIMNLAKHESL